MWRSTVVTRLEAAQRALRERRPAEAHTELEAASESVLAAAQAVDDDDALRARLESEAEHLVRLARRASAPAEERSADALREELVAARRRLEHVFDAR
jgi:hypothetical protein